MWTSKDLDKGRDDATPEQMERLKAAVAAAMEVKDEDPAPAEVQEKKTTAARQECTDCDSCGDCGRTLRFTVDPVDEAEDPAPECEEDEEVLQQPPAFATVHLHGGRDPEPETITTVDTPEARAHAEETRRLVIDGREYRPSSRTITIEGREYTLADDPGIVLRPAVTEVEETAQEPAGDAAEPAVDAEDHPGPSEAAEPDVTPAAETRELRPCPFCGADVTLTYYRRWNVTGHAPGCVLAPGFAQGRTREQMAAAWNRRR